MKIGKTEMKSSNYEKLLLVKIVSKVTFNEHLDYLIDKASLKVNALSRVVPYMNENKKCILNHSFFLSQFNYCPPVWMFHSHTLNNKINRLHERCVNIVYNGTKSTYENFLVKDRSVSVHIST